MSVGIIGPIGVDNLSDFAISRAFRITEDKNAGSANCKVCGTGLEKGKGRAAIIGVMAGEVFRAYLCKKCVARVERATKRMDERANEGYPKPPGLPKESTE